MGRLFACIVCRGRGWLRGWNVIGEPVQSPCRACGGSGLVRASLDAANDIDLAQPSDHG